MPLLLRRTLIRLLLLAVFFNTVIGSVAHEAEHLGQGVPALSALSAPPADEHADDAEHDSQAHGACAWCLAFAHPGIATAALPAVPAPAVHGGRLRSQAHEAFVPSPGRWPFASRDPPRILS